MTRRPTVMTRRLGGHQAGGRGHERAFSLPTFLLCPLELDRSIETGYARLALKLGLTLEQQFGIYP
jgi:hypothetical protein